MSRVPFARTRVRLGARVSIAVLLLACAVSPAVARAQSVVNYTFHVPASVQTNPCFPADVVNLSGDVHVVITSTAGGGGYRIANQLNSQLSGVSVTRGTRYVSSETQYDGWLARAPFPMVHTNTYDWHLTSQSRTPNYVLHMTMHETVAANGVPTAAVDSWRMDCEG
jgi:hypothetical protein